MQSSGHISEWYWNKAKLFLSRATDDTAERSSEELLFWASIALEVLAKWALSSVSPSLIVDPQVDGGNALLKAAGMMPTKGSLPTAQARTIYSRCATAFRPFNASVALRMAGNRNEYLHGTGIDFTKIPTNIWWQEFWAQAEILLTARGAELEELIGGDDRLTTARKHLRNHESYLEDKWTALQESALQRRDRHEGGLFSSHEAASWESESPSADMASTYREPCECPACGELGWIGGEDLIREMEVDEHADGELHAFAAIGADCFACDHCHLTLTGADLLTEAKLDEFVAEVDPYDYYEPEYGND